MCNLCLVFLDDDSNVEKSDTLKRKVVEEKRQREHILQLNQILAKEVMEKSKMVAGTFSARFYFFSDVTSACDSNRFINNT